MHAWPSDGARCLIFGRTLRLLPYFTANSEGSDETAQMRRLVWAVTGRLCDKYHNLMSWLIFVFGVEFYVYTSLLKRSVCHRVDGFWFRNWSFRTWNVKLINFYNGLKKYQKIISKPELSDSQGRYIVLNTTWLTFEPRHEKTCLQGLRPGKTQTGLLSYIS